MVFGYAGMQPATGGRKALLYVAGAFNFGAALILVVLGFNMFGDGAQDLLDPQRKSGK